MDVGPPDGTSTTPTTPWSETELPTIDVYVHVITDGARGEIDSDILDLQFEILNEAFASTGWAFRSATVDVTDNPSWYHADWGDSAERDMKRSLHQGDQRHLNVYINEPLGVWTGWATFPMQYARNPTLDGVVLDSTVLVGGGGAPWDAGDQLVHEVGHWMGLWHPFEGGCQGGDGVADTPAEDRPAWGCNPSRDTCGGTGTDPVHNYMDYSDDDCIDHFTPGQADRIAWALSEYRGLYRSGP